MDLAKPGSRLEGVLSTLDGAQFKGFVSLTTKRLNTNVSVEYNLRLPRSTFIQSGMLIRYANGIYMVGDGSDDFLAGPTFIVKRLIQATKSYGWARTVSTVDPVTGLSKDSGAPTNLGTAYGLLLEGSKISDIFQVQDSRYQFISNSPLQVNDKLGPYTVTYVIDRIGLWFSEVK